MVGYTVVELVVVMVLMGILAANAMPHFFTASRFEEMGFADVTAAAIRQARGLAVASGCDTVVSAAHCRNASACMAAAAAAGSSLPAISSW